jgi:hypothetical protein
MKLILLTGLFSGLFILSSNAFATSTTATNAQFKKECKAEGKKGKAFKECMKNKKEAAASSHSTSAQ